MAFTYYADSGEGIFGGRIGYPSWVPAVGYVGNASTNTVNDVKGTDITTAVIFKAWSGCAWAPWWGKYGSMIFTGGGHNDGSENTIYRYDVATRLVSKIKPTAVAYPKTDTSYIADTVTGWMWANTTAGDATVQVGEAFTVHFYSYLVALPPSAISGGATNGWLYTPGRVTMPLSGQTGTNQAHKLRLGLDTVWTMDGPSNPGFNGEYGYAIYDSKRNRIWTGQSSVASPVVARYRDLTAGTAGSISMSGLGAEGFNSYYHAGGYHTAADVIMAVRFSDSTFSFQIFDPVTNTGYNATVNATGGPNVSTTPEGAWDWSDVWNSWVYYPADGTNTLYFLKSPSDPRTGTWTWSSQTVIGTITANDPASPGYNRIRHCSALGDTLLWAALYNSPIQAIRVNTPP